MFDSSSKLDEIFIFFQHFVISLIGIVGNSLVLLVYGKNYRDNETVKFFIVNLALTDLFCCVLSVPLNCYMELANYTTSSDLLCKLHQFFNIINISYSCMLMVLVAFERFFSIILPFQRIVTKLRAKIIMLILILVCLMVAIPGSLGYGIFHKTFKVDTNTTTENFFAVHPTSNGSSDTSSSSNQYPIRIKYLNDDVEGLNLNSNEANSEFKVYEATVKESKRLAAAATAEPSESSSSPPFLSSLSSSSSSTLKPVPSSKFNEINMDHPIKLTERLSIKLECSHHIFAAYYSYDLNDLNKVVTFVRDEDLTLNEINYYPKIDGLSASLSYQQQQKPRHQSVDYEQQAAQQFFSQDKLLNYSMTIEKTARFFGPMLNSLCAYALNMHDQQQNDNNGNENRRDLNDFSLDISWENSGKCFPNEKLITSIQMSYLRLIQNLLIVVCFTIIFVLYALIYVFVTKRRQLKSTRAKYYRNILLRSRKNTNAGTLGGMVEATTTMTTAHSGLINSCRGSSSPNNQKNHHHHRHHQNGGNGNLMKSKSAEKKINKPKTQQQQQQQLNNIAESKINTVVRLSSCKNVSQLANLIELAGSNQNLAKEQQQQQPGDIFSVDSSLNSNVPATELLMKTGGGSDNNEDEMKSLLKDDNNNNNINQISNSASNEDIKLNVRHSGGISSLNSMEQMPNDSTTDHNLSKSTQTNSSALHHLKNTTTTNNHNNNNNNNIYLINKSKSFNSFQTNTTPSLPKFEFSMTEMNNNNNNNERSFVNQSLDDASYPSCTHRTTMMANLRTAFMLFVVTLIMAVVYTPAILISFHVIDYNPFTWNLYFVINAINPIVYSFLNENFRKSLRASFMIIVSRD